jgi:8-oxo-dGTP pyrophosphatase MutT (NUDIX family)
LLFILEQLINRLKNGLSRPLPGIQAQYLMAPMLRERIEPGSLKEGQYRPSAVMILFCEDEENDIFIPLTERMSYQGVHSAQVSLPGGKYEPYDENLMNTAMRECYEEIGIKDLEVIGKLTQLFIPVSGFLVQPYIGVCNIKNPPMKNQPREVKTILRLKLDAFLSEDIIKQGSIEMPGNLKISTPWFEVEGLKVWGATAMILSELRELMKTTS